jgi:MtN3 and saliva related transmembrane protein
MPSQLIDAVGTIGAFLTTVCWVPQAIRIVRSRNTNAISLSASIAFTLGVALWLIYGFALGDWPLIISNLVTLILMTVIVALKLCYG